jgi:hypothetical protein
VAIAVRNSSIVYVNNASSVVYTLPAGSAAGDACFVFVEHGFAVTAPAGWQTWDNSAGSNVNGATFWKKLVAADITAGNITINFAGTYYGIVAGISFVGSVVPRSAGVFQRNSSGAGPRSLTEPNATNGDYAIHFSGMRLNGTITSSRGASLQSSSNLNASGILYGELLAATSSITETFTFSATPAGDYDAVLVVKPDDGTTRVPIQQFTRQSVMSVSGKVSSHQFNRQALLTPNMPLKAHGFVRLVLLSPATVTAVSMRQFVRLVLLSPAPVSTSHRRMSLL